MAGLGLGLSSRARVGKGKFAPGPGQFYTDFSEYTVDQQPSDWTRRLAADFTWVVEAGSGYTGGKALHSVEGASDAQNGLSWDEMDGVSGQEDVEILYRIKFPVITDNEMLAMIRGEGAVGSATLYRHGARLVTGGIVAVQRYNAGSFATIGTVADFDYDADTWYKVRVLASGNFHAASAWKEGTPEPEEWMTSGTDESKLTSGWIGLFKFRFASSIIDYYSVGVAGVPPFDPDDPQGTQSGVALDTTGVVLDQDFDGGGFEP